MHIALRNPISLIKMYNIEYWNVYHLKKRYSNKSLPREKRIDIKLFEKIVNKGNILLQHFVYLFNIFFLNFLILKISLILLYCMILFSSDRLKIV